MPNRQTILLILTGFALAYGAYSLLAGSDTGPAPAAVKSDKELAALVEQVDAALAEHALNPVEQHRMALLSGETVADPFLKREPKNGDSRLAMREGDDRFTYSGYIALGPTRYAVINESEYTTGQVVDDTGYAVVSITPEMVLLEGRNQGSGAMEQVAIPIQEDLITFAEEPSEE